MLLGFLTVQFSLGQRRIVDLCFDSRQGGWDRGDAERVREEGLLGAGGRAIVPSITALMTVMWQRAVILRLVGRRGHWGVAGGGEGRGYGLICIK